LYISYIVAVSSIGAELKNHSKTTELPQQVIDKLYRIKP
jgi:hypothetical protein